jgi:hypothetical protein
MYFPFFDRWRSSRSAWSGVCDGDSTNEFRKTPERAKCEAFAAYGIPWADRAKYEGDDLESVELGGADPDSVKGRRCDIRNPWPQPHAPRPGVYEKDSAEKFLHAEVCAGHMTTADLVTTPQRLVLPVEL